MLFLIIIVLIYSSVVDSLSVLVTGWPKDMDPLPESSLCLQDLVSSSGGGGGQVNEQGNNLEQPLLLHHEPITHHEPLEKLKRGEWECEVESPAGSVQGASGDVQGGSWSPQTDFPRRACRHEHKVFLTNTIPIFYKLLRGPLNFSKELLVNELDFLLMITSEVAIIDLWSISTSSSE